MLNLEQIYMYMYLILKASILSLSKQIFFPNLNLFYIKYIKTSKNIIKLIRLKQIF